MSKYVKLSPNFHILLNPANRYRTELNLTFSSGGSYFEKESQKGLTHLLEHCEVERTKNLSKQGLNNLVFEKDIYKNASTGPLMKDITTSGHKDDFETMLDLILGFGFEPEFSDEILEIQKQIILREIAQRKGDPAYRIKKLVLENIYKEGSKELIDVMGKEENVAKATIDDLRELHARVMKDSHFILSVVGGNIDEELILKKLEPLCQKFKSDSTHPIDFDVENRIQDFKYKPIVSELAHDNCVLNLAIPLTLNFGFRAIRDILAEMLFSYPEGILYKTLRDEMGLVYSVDFSFDESLQMLKIFLVGEIGNTQRLIEETIKVLNKPEEFITEQKVNLIKNLYIKRQQIASDNPYNPIDYMVTTLLNYGIEQKYEEFLDEIKKVQVNEVLSYAKELKINLKDMRVVAVSRDKSIEKLKLNY